MAATERATASLDAKQGKIIITTPQADQHLAFIKSLPEARSDKFRKRWSVLATPCTAAMIMAEKVFDCDVELCLLGQDWYRGLAANFLLDTEGFKDQPKLRQHDMLSHQCVTYHWAKDKRGAYIGHEMGAMKTACAIITAWNTGCDRILIVCPKRVVGVWPREMERHGPQDFHATLFDGTGTVAKKVERAEKEWVANSGRMHLNVIGYEASIQPPFVKWATSKQWDMVILDEGHRCKSPSGKASKTAYEVGKRAKRKIVLSGTITPHDYLDIFAQYRFLDAGIFGSSFTAFRQKYADMNPMFPSKVDGWKDIEDLKKKMHQIYYRVRTQDVVDLPSLMHEYIACDLSPKARKIYEDIEKEGLAELFDGTVSIDNALVTLQKIQQVCQGFIFDDDRKLHEIDDAKERCLEDLLEDLPKDEPFCVFCWYRHDLAVVERVAKATGRRYGELSGARNDLSEKAEMRADVNLMAIQMQSGGVGIDLTRACYGAFLTPTFRWGDFTQAIKRMHRPGQKRPCRLYHIMANNTVDMVIRQVLKNRETMIDAVMDQDKMVSEVLRELKLQRGK